MELPYLVPRIEAALSTKSRKNGEGREKRKKKKRRGGRKGETRVRSGGQAFCHRFPLFTGWIRLNEGSKWLILASRKSSALSRRVRNGGKRTRRSFKFELERGDIARGNRCGERNCWMLRRYAIFSNMEELRSFSRICSPSFWSSSLDRYEILNITNF